MRTGTAASWRAGWCGSWVVPGALFAHVPLQVWKAACSYPLPVFSQYRMWRWIFLGSDADENSREMLGLFCSGERVEAGAWPLEGSGVVLLPRGCGRPRTPLAEGAGQPLVLPRGTPSERLPPPLSKDGLWPALPGSRSLGSGWLSCRGLPGAGAPAISQGCGGVGQQ